MKYVPLVVAVLIMSCSTNDVTAQDVGNQASKHQNDPPLTQRIIDDTLWRIKMISGIAHRELLGVSSDRPLWFRCGPFWVDIHGQLIAPNDRAIGFWGVDVPTVPMRR